MFSIKLLHSKQQKYTQIHKQPSKPNPIHERRKRKATAAPGSKRPALGHLEPRGNLAKRQRVQGGDGQVAKTQTHTIGNGPLERSTKKGNKCPSVQNMRKEKIKKKLDGQINKTEQGKTHTQPMSNGHFNTGTQKGNKSLSVPNMRSKKKIKRLDGQKNKGKMNTGPFNINTQRTNNCPSALNTKKMKENQKNGGEKGSVMNVNKSNQRTASTLNTRKKKKGRNKGVGKITGLVAPNKGKREMNEGGNNKMREVNGGGNKKKREMNGGGNNKKREMNGRGGKRKRNRKGNMTSNQPKENESSNKEVNKGVVKKRVFLMPQKGKKTLNEDRKKGMEEEARRNNEGNALFYKETGMTQNTWNSSENNDFAEEWDENYNSKMEMENSFDRIDAPEDIPFNSEGETHTGQRNSRSELKTRKEYRDESESGYSYDNQNNGTDLENAVEGSEMMMKASEEISEENLAGKKERGRKDIKKVKKGKAKEKNEREHKSEEGSNNIQDKSLIVGEPLSILPTRNDNVIVALAPGKDLYIQGVVAVRALIGSVQVLGYRIKEGEEQTIYSLPSAALLGLRAIDVRSLESSEPLLEAKGVPANWIQGVLEKQGEGISVVEFVKVNPAGIKFLKRVGWKRLVNCQHNHWPWDKVGTSLVTPNNCRSLRLTQEGTDWHNAIDTINTAWKFGNSVRVVVCGGKGVGKSTFFKYVANGLLTTSPTVLCLDLDPGQPEFSLPTCLSLVKLNKPMLGPPHAQHISDITEYYKRVLVGDINPQFMLQRYLAAVRRLNKEISQHPDIPLLVNTMGWVEGTGLAINVDVIRIIQPTHLVQINSRTAYRNFPMDMTRQAVMKAKECITTRPGNTELHYSFTTLRSVTSAKGGGSFQPRELRELRILNEVSRLIQGGVGGKPRTIIIPWNTVAIHVCGEKVPRDRILQVINGQLVGLCHVEPRNIGAVRPDLPKHLQDDAEFGDLLAWGIISGINPVARELHVLISSTSTTGATTSLASSTEESSSTGGIDTLSTGASSLSLASSAAEIKNRVNAVVMPKLQLPAAVYKQFSSGESPYLQSSSEMGAPKLRVDRHLKPRGRSDAGKK